VANASGMVRGDIKKHLAAAEESKNIYGRRVVADNMAISKKDVSASEARRSSTEKRA